MPRRVVERRVESEDVGFAGYLFQEPEPAVFPLFTRRVAANDAESPRCGVLPDERADVSHTHDAQRPFGRLPALCACEVSECRADPLQDAPGVAASGRGDLDSVLRAPGPVDVVEPDGRRGDHSYARTRQERFVAPGAGAYHQRVGVVCVGGRNCRPGEVFYLGERLQDTPQKGYGAVGNDFHNLVYLSPFLVIRVNKDR